MNRPPSTRSELLASGATCIAEVSSLPDDPDERAETRAYTRLGVWWHSESDRPFIAVVEGLCGPAADDDMVDRFRAVLTGSLGRAIGWFDPSNLRDDLSEALPADAETAYPDANTLRARRAAEKRGYQGPDSMPEAVAWLYEGEEGELATHQARRIETDFGVPFRTGYNAIAGGALTGWPKAFIAALRFFDRGAWRNAKREAEPSVDLAMAREERALARDIGNAP